MKKQPTLNQVQKIVARWKDDKLIEELRKAAKDAFDSQSEDWGSVCLWSLAADRLEELL